MQKILKRFFNFCIFKDIPKEKDRSLATSITLERDEYEKIKVPSNIFDRFGTRSETDAK